MFQLTLVNTQIVKLNFSNEDEPGYCACHTIFPGMTFGLITATAVQANDVVIDQLVVKPRLKIVNLEEHSNVPVMLNDVLIGYMDERQGVFHIVPGNEDIELMLSFYVEDGNL